MLFAEPESEHDFPIGIMVLFYFEIIVVTIEIPFNSDFF